MVTSITLGGGFIIEKHSGMKNEIRKAYISLLSLTINIFKAYVNDFIVDRGKHLRWCNNY